MMYIDNQRQKAILSRDALFKDPGGGIFKRKERDFVLKNPLLNLHNSIRDSAIEYFKKYDIVWWGEDNSRPSGHLLSSQIACINHLFPIRENKELALAVLQRIAPDVIEPMVVDNGFVGFEVIGKENYLGEKSHLRGEYSTSVDAVMVGRKPNGKCLLVLIEWKYTESYELGKNLYIPPRANIYDKLIGDNDSPIQLEPPSSLYFEPFYQLMRQTLLGWKMVSAKEFNADEYIHIHVIPKDNDALLQRITSDSLIGDSMTDAWKRVLKNSNSYKLVDPRSFLDPISILDGTKSWIGYLKTRYWDG